MQDDRRGVEFSSLRLRHHRAVCFSARARDQRHEGDDIVLFLLKRLLAPADDAREDLLPPRPDRDDEPPAYGELRAQGFGHLAAAGRDDDGIERCLFGQTSRAVPVVDCDIVVPERLQAMLGPVCQNGMPLNGKNVGGDAAHDSGGIAGARANLEHAIIGTELGQLDHARDDVGL